VRKDLQVLRDRPVAALLGARWISLLGNAIAPVALAFTVLDLPGGSAGELGVVLTARMASQVVFVLLGGAIADRFSRTGVMIGADVAAGVFQATAATLVVTGHATVTLLAVLATANGAAAALFLPASSSVMPQLVSGEQLQSANALLRLSMNIGTILGAAISGLLVAGIGSGQTLAVDAGTFFVSAALLTTIRVPASDDGSRESASLIAQLRAGWQEFRSRQWVWVMVAQLSFVNILLASGFYVLGPVVAKASLGGAVGWGTVLTGQSLGLVLGSFVAMRVRPRYPVRVALILTMGFPMPLFLLAARAPALAIASVAFVAGICIDVYEVLFDTVLQKHIPAEALSRVMSYYSVGAFALVPMGVAAVGPISEAAGTGPTLVGAAVLMLLAGPTVLLLPSVRSVAAEPPADPDAGPDATSGTGPEAADPRAGASDADTDAVTRS
jgi:MFS family permease